MGVDSFTPYILFCLSTVTFVLGYYGVSKKICYVPSTPGVIRFKGSWAVIVGTIQILLASLLFLFGWTYYENVYNLYYAVILVLLNIFIGYKLFYFYESNQKKPKSNKLQPINWKRVCISVGIIILITLFAFYYLFFPK